MSKMLHYTFDGKQVEESDPRADYQINPNDSESDKNAIIESYKKLAPLTPPAPAEPSTLESPNYGTDESKEFHELIVPVAIASKPAQLATKSDAKK